MAAVVGVDPASKTTLKDMDSVASSYNRTYTDAYFKCVCMPVFSIPCILPRTHTYNRTYTDAYFKYVCILSSLLIMHDMITHHA